MEKNSSSLVDIVNWRASIHPEKIAYTFLADGEDKEEVITFGTLDQHARSVAVYLQSLNLEGERALLLFPSGIQYITAFLGCLYAGVIAIPAYPPRKNRLGERIDSIISDADAKVVLTSSKIFSDLNRKFEDEQYLKALTWIEIDNINYSNYEVWKKPALNRDMLAFLQYTSGSTGSPKGVMVSHGNILANSEYIKQLYSLHEGSVSVAWLPIFHDLGMMDGIIQPLYSGYHGVVMAPVSFLEKPFRWLKAITKYRGTHAGGPNFTYDLCVSKITDDQLSQLELSCWESAFNGAEPVRYATWKNFAKKFEVCGFRSHHYWAGYGLAESTLLVSGSELRKEPVFCKVDSDALKNNRMVEILDETEGTLLMSSGRTILDTKVVIVDPEKSERCETGMIGEVWVSSPSVAQGYWRREKESKETFGAYISDTNEGPFLRTGDLGFLKDNLLYVTGRLKDVIIIRGQNYYPQDIEFTVEQAHATLKTTGGAAFSTDVKGEERLVVIQEMERTALRDLNVTDVCDHISRAISQHHELKVYAIVLIKPGSLPKTSSGKTQRKACKKAFLENTLSVVGEWYERESVNKAAGEEELKFESFAQSSQSNIQKWLLHKVAQCFKVSVDAVSIDEPIDKLGMDSMIAVQLSSDIGSWLNMEISQTLLYDYPTIKSLASYLFSEVAKQSVQPTTVDDKVASNEAIAVIGMGCRFPGAVDIEAYTQLLESGESAVVQVPAERWNQDQLSTLSVQETEDIKWAGLLENIDEFDPQFFGISPKEAVNIDPQQRLLLEVSWEALENAGIPSSKIAGKSVGVFVGVSSNEYSALGDFSNLNAYSGTGGAFSIVANRLSYTYDLRGPSIAIDTACSSSLVAIHQACDSLRTGESTMAIAGGVNLLITPKWSIVFSRAHMLANDGKCKTFDASADGYVRGEGCGIVILKRLSDATRDGNTIHAVIKGSAINQDGRSNGLTAPNGPSQEAVIQKALKVANVLPSDIGYVETHGSGTPLGDPIEINALKKVLMQNRNSSETCFVGSVKTNIGHLEAAAGIAGFIKGVLSVKNKRIYPHLNFTSLNPQIRIENTPIKITSRVLPWPGNKRLAGISSFGFGGTNAHIVLQESPITNEPSVADRPAHVFTLSAKTGEALDASLDKHITFFMANEALALRDVCYSANVGRNHFSHRLAVTADSISDLKEKLAAGKTGKQNSDFSRTQLTSHTDRKIAFLFTGQGCQYKGMAQELYETVKIFKEQFDKCDLILKKYLGISIAQELYAITDQRGGENNIDNTQYTQPLLFAVEYSLAMLWREWGVHPTAVMGHSVGEYVAACIADVFSLEDGLKLISERARLMQTLPVNEGEMIAVTTTEANVLKIILPYQKVVSIAAINGPEQVVISGSKSAMQDIIKQLEASEIKWVKLQVSHAFHSPQMKPILNEFEKVARSINYQAPRIHLISNVTGIFMQDEIATPEYWVNHIMAPVKFFDSVSTLLTNKYSIFIEIGPKPTLLSIIRSYGIEEDVEMLSSINQRESNWKTLSRSLASLFLHNVDVQWENVYRGCGKNIVLPSYSFQRSRYWIDEDKAMSTKVFSNHAKERKISKTHSLLGSLNEEDFVSGNFSWQRKVDNITSSKRDDHDKIFISFATYIEIASSAVREVFGDRNLQLKELKIHQPFIVNSKDALLQTRLYNNSSGQLSVQVLAVTDAAVSGVASEVVCASANVDFSFYPAYTQSLN